MAKNTKTPLVWILTGDRQGDNRQLFALAEGLCLPYEAKRLTYNWLRHIAQLRGERMLHLTGQSRRMLAPPWPDVVIGLGYENVPVSRYIRRRSGGRTRLVQIGNPRTAIDDIDLVITTPQYPRSPASNVLRVPFPIGNPVRAATETQEEEEWLRSFAKPRRLVAVGGSTRQWKIDTAELSRAIRYLQDLSAGDGGSVIAVTSRRTPPAIKRLLEDRLTGDRDAVVDNHPRFAVLLARCDECFVTADSVSMLSEAILTGKPVAMIPITRTLRGRIGHWLRDRGLDLRSHADLSKFWEYLTVNDLAGSIESPIASTVGDTVAVAVSAVREVIECD
jgi:mitochondrial fission protein ELM1